MLLKTKYFGEKEIESGKNIYFPQGLLGLEEYKNYTLFEMPESKRVMCMQCVDEPLLAFFIINPWEFFADYNIEISDEELTVIGIAKVKDMAVFSILTVGDGTEITANLLAPIVVNVNTRTAMQIILNEEQYDTKHAIPDVPNPEQTQEV